MDRDSRSCDHALRARARRADAQRQALAAALAGRTLDTAPPTELSPEELRARMAATRPAFEGL